MAKQVFEVGDILKMSICQYDMERRYRYLVLAVKEKPVSAEFSIYEYAVLMRTDVMTTFWTATIDDIGNLYEKIGHIDISEYLTEGQAEQTEEQGVEENDV